MHGYGILTMVNGYKYVGELESNAMQGHGIIYNKTGEYVNSGWFEQSDLKTEKPEADVLKFLSKYK